MPPWSRETVKCAFWRHMRCNGTLNRLQSAEHSSAPCPPRARGLLCASCVRALAGCPGNKVEVTKPARNAKSAHTRPIPVRGPRARLQGCIASPAVRRGGQLTIPVYLEAHFRTIRKDDMRHCLNASPPVPPRRRLSSECENARSMEGALSKGSLNHGLGSCQNAAMGAPWWRT